MKELTRATILADKMIKLEYEGPISEVCQSEVPLDDISAPATVRTGSGQ